MRNDELDDFAIRWLATGNSEGRNSANCPAFMTSLLSSLSLDSTEIRSAQLFLRRVQSDVAAFRHRQKRRREGVAHG